MKRIALSLLGLLVASACASPSSAYAYVWSIGNPSTLVAYQVGGGVITVASSSLLTCETNELVLDAKPFVYDYKVGSPGKGILCENKYGAPIAAYYQKGSPATVTVMTKNGAVSVTVLPAPPSQPIGHLPFH